MIKSLKLSEDWDVTLDAGGNLSALEGAPRVAQDVACAGRLFTGEAYFQPRAGIPHFDGELGQLPPDQLVRARLDAAALSVPGVATAATELAVYNRRDAEGRPDRTLTGLIRVTTTEGETTHAAIQYGH